MSDKVAILGAPIVLFAYNVMDISRNQLTVHSNLGELGMFAGTISRVLHDLCYVLLHIFVKICTPNSQPPRMSTTVKT